MGAAETEYFLVVHGDIDDFDEWVLFGSQLVDVHVIDGGDIVKRVD